MPRSSWTAGVLGVCSLVLACATGESSTPGGDFTTSAGSSGSPAQAGAGGASGAPSGAGGGQGGAAGTFGASGTSFGTAGTTIGAAGTSFGTAGSANSGSSGAGGTGTAGTAGGGAGGAGTAGSGTAGSGTAGAGGVKPTVCPEPAGTAQPLPLTVSEHFIAGGYFAGPAANTSGIVQSACEARPAGHTIGACYKFVFQASALEGDGAYAGVFWQYGQDNWGEDAGLNVAAGATKVTFKAWSASGGELVEFSAGGIGGNGTLCADTVNLGQGNGTKVTMTKTPTQYSIDLKGQTYAKGIIGGFVWSTAVTSTAQVVSFYVDEIQWVK